MVRQVKRAFRYRFHPTDEQAAEPARTFGCARLVYNQALEERTRAWFTEHHRVPCAQSSTITGFLAEHGEYPRFKAEKKSREAAEYTDSAFRWRDGELTPAKTTEPLAIVWSWPLPEGAEPTAVTVSRDVAGRWFCSILRTDTIT